MGSGHKMWPGNQGSGSPKMSKNHEYKCKLQERNQISINNLDHVNASVIKMQFMIKCKIYEPVLGIRFHLQKKYQLKHF